MARGNIDILAISELKCTGMGEFNAEDHHIYYCWQESLRNGAAVSQQESKLLYLDAILRTTEWSVSKGNHSISW